MAETDHNPQAQGEPGSREPNRSHAAEKVDMREHFMKQLGSEPELPIQGQEPAPAGEPRREAPTDEQTSGTEADDKSGADANKQNEPLSEESKAEFTTEFVDDDNNVVGYADAQGNEFNADGTPYTPDAGDEPGEEEPGQEEVIGALQVDDSSYSVDDVRKLVQSNRELDADYRRKTTVMSRMREEYAVQGKEMETVGLFFSGLARQNVDRLEKVDTKDMSPEEFSAYRQQYDGAKRASQQMNQSVIGVRESYNKAREAHLDQQAAESAEVMQKIDKRWNNEFYSKVRDFAVDSGRYTAEEFSDVTDWRSMEGLVSLMDADGVRKIAENPASGESEISEPGKRKRRRQRQRQNRSSTGQFQSSKATVLESQNARKDGSLRDHFKAKLAAERR